jgi:hypothetical protein
MAHEPAIDQDIGLYLGALQKYNDKYGAGQGNVTVASNTAPGYAFQNPQTQENYPLYPDTGLNFQAEVHPDPTQEEKVKPRYTRQNFYTPWSGSGGGPPKGELDEYGRDMSLNGKPYYSPFSGGDMGPRAPQPYLTDGVTDYPTHNPGFGVDASGTW